MRPGDFGEQNVTGHHDVFGGARNAAEAEAGGFHALSACLAGAAQMQVFTVLDRWAAAAIWRTPWRAGPNAAFITGLPSSEMATIPASFMEPDFRPALHRRCSS